MSQVIVIQNSRELMRGCLICGAKHWDCTVDGCKPRGGNRPGDVLHCKICNTVYVVDPVEGHAIHRITGAWPPESPPDGRGHRAG